jgi:hypothetical protein
VLVCWAVIGSECEVPSLGIRLIEVTSKRATSVSPLWKHRPRSTLAHALVRLQVRNLTGWNVFQTYTKLMPNLMKGPGGQPFVADEMKPYWTFAQCLIIRSCLTKLINLKTDGRRRPCGPSLSAWHQTAFAADYMAGMYGMKPRGPSIVRSYINLII